MSRLDFLLNKCKDYIDLYIDMDGVIVDFYNDIETLPPIYVSAFHNDRLKFWQLIDHDYGSKFWTMLNWNCDGRKLFIKLQTQAKTPTILSAYPSFGIRTPDVCTIGKRIWIDKNIDRTQKAIFCLSSNKYLQANTNSILIDDSEKNINAWNNAGGMGVLFKSYKQAIFDLEKHLETYIRGVL